MSKTESNLIQSGIPACVMSSEYYYFLRTSLYLVRLNIFEWIKFLRRHLHQIQENWAGRNVITTSSVNSQLITHTEINLKSTTSNRFNFWIINSLMDSWEVRLTWLDCICKHWHSLPMHIHLWLLHQQVQQLTCLHLQATVGNML